MRTSKASTLIEVLIVLLVGPLLMSTALSILNLLSHYDYQITERQNFIGLIQLRKRVALGSQIKISKDRLLMNYRNNELELICDVDILYETKGYMEYLTGLDQCSWETDKGLIYLEYSYKQNPVRVFIGHAA